MSKITTNSRCQMSDSRPQTRSPDPGPKTRSSTGLTVAKMAILAIFGAFWSQKVPRVSGFLGPKTAGLIVYFMRFLAVACVIFTRFLVFTYWRPFFGGSKKRCCSRVTFRWVDPSTATLFYLASTCRFLAFWRHVRKVWRASVTVAFLALYRHVRKKWRPPKSGPNSEV